MIALVKSNPDYTFARAFLAMWHFMAARAYDNHEKIFQVMSLSIRELEKADEVETADLHEWMVVQYCKGIILTAIHSPAEYLQCGIKAFQDILQKKSDLDQLYAGRMIFYSKWLWPNIYFFLGKAYLNNRRYDDALKILQKGMTFEMMPPYKERLQMANRRPERKKNLLSA